MKHIYAHSVAQVGYVQTSASIVDSLDGWADGEGGKCIEYETFVSNMEQSDNPVHKEFLAEVQEVFKENAIGDLVIYCD